MDSLNRTVQKKPWVTTLLLLILITALGGYLRFRYLAKSDFPLNDGGMFYTMIRDLQANQYRLPAFTSYNQANIPFAYPPLSFYTVGLLNQYLAINLLALFRFYPLFFNLLSIPLFYFLAKELTRQNKFRSILATAFYAILLSSYEWLIIGGGLTRSPAHTYFIGALLFYLVYLRTAQKKHFVFSLIFAALMTLHHLEFTWFLAFSMFLFAFQKGRILSNSVRVGMYYLLLMLLISPFWMTVIGFHGIRPFLSAFSSGEFNLIDSVSRLFTLVFTEELLSNYINILAILGIFFTLATKESRKLAIWLLLITLLDNRSAFRSLVFPVSVLAAIGLDHILRALLSSISALGTESSNPGNLRKANAFTIFFVGFSILYPFFLGYLATYYDHKVLTALSKSEIQAMEWVEENTPAQSRFILVNSSPSWIVDRAGEWFPTLTGRKSMTTVQGSEWLPRLEYQLVKQQSIQFRQCIQTGKDCPDLWGDSGSDHPKYIFISKSECNQNPDGCRQKVESLFGNTKEYTMVYENESVAIFSVPF